MRFQDYYKFNIWVELWFPEHLKEDCTHLSLQHLRLGWLASLPN